MGKSKEQYLAMGFEPKMAEYFAAGRRKITGVEANEGFTLTLTFDNGERRLYDAAPLLKEGTVFEPLKQGEIFKRVYLDECGAVAWDIDPNVDSSEVWNNKIDLCPDSCYVDSISLEGGAANA